MLKKINIIFAASIIWVLSGSVGLAQNQKPNQSNRFPPNPLELRIRREPLLPRSPSDRKPLTPEESQQLSTALDALNQEATAMFQAGNKQEAYDTWNRELRLRRFLGSLQETQALGRVGDIAWKDNERLQVQFITERLQKIQKQALPVKSKSKNPPDTQLLQALGLAFQQVRSPKPALEVYEAVLKNVRTLQDTAAEIATLNNIALISLSWFEYPRAAAAYEQLLSLATAKGDSTNERTYLKQLSYIYNQTKQPQQALNVRSKLVEIATKEQNLVELPVLKMEIAADYQALAKENPNLIESAFKNYQEAYQIAWESEQYVRAGEALRKLIALYRSQGQTDEAIQTIQILIQTEEKAANYYGMMSAYDQLGQIYLERKENPQALTAFQKGLEIAKLLNHEEEYFTQQIAKVGS